MLGLGNSLITVGVFDNEFTILDTSPEVWLKFDTGQTTPDLAGPDNDTGDADVHWADQSGNGNDASQSNDAKQGSFSDGAWKSELNDDFITLDSSITLTDEYTIFIVFRTDNLLDTIFGSTNNLMRIGQNSGTKVRVRHGASYVQNDMFYETGEAPTTTSHALFRIDRNASDEFSVTQNSTTVLIDEQTVNGGTFVITNIPSGSYGIGAERLYELVIFDRALTASEISLVEADILDRTSLSAD